MAAPGAAIFFKRMLMSLRLPADLDEIGLIQTRRNLAGLQIIISNKERL